MFWLLLQTPGVINISEEADWACADALLWLFLPVSAVTPKPMALKPSQASLFFGRHESVTAT